MRIKATNKIKLLANMQGYEIKWNSLGFRFHSANHYALGLIYPQLTFELLLMVSLTIACVNLSR